ncbi:hypothetical protein AB0465_37400 [Streptomyces griseoviridis]|uniref:hypothetical protein n=1 Tax=Streptomyces griseoviridis TaxID=45398 RepID=UPI00344F1707
MSTSRLSAARLARLAVEALPSESRVTFDAADGEITWAPETALAAAGHICQHWGIGVSTRPLTVEAHRLGGITVVLRHEVWHGTYRALVQESPDLGSAIVQLCGHIGCTEEAAPGARCHLHLTDPTPEHYPPTHWAEIAADRWGRRHPTSGENKTLLDNERNQLIRAALDAGMKPIHLHRRTGIARTTIDRVLSPQVTTVEGIGPDDAA